MDDWTRSMVRSTATLLNFRFAGETRTTGNALPAANDVDVKSKADAATELFRMNSLRVIFKQFKGSPQNTESVVKLSVLAKACCNPKDVSFMSIL
jgi:hypothetical protein